ncbi:MAG: hypothetical protein ACTSQI_16350 [Candidatus Helarchaeota archaeon]
MCNSCDCPDFEKCSIRGTAPIGWCCPRCIGFNPLDLLCPNRFETHKTKEFLHIPVKEYILSLQEH